MVLDILTSKLKYSMWKKIGISQLKLPIFNFLFISASKNGFRL